MGALGQHGGRDQSEPELSLDGPARLDFRRRRAGRGHLGFTIAEVLLAGSLAVVLLVPLTIALSASARIYSAGSVSQAQLLAGNWALDRMIRDVQQSLDVLDVSPGELGLGSQLVANDTKDYERITWRLDNGVLTRQITLAADTVSPADLEPAVYATGVTAFVPRGQKLWSKLDAVFDVWDPTVGPPGTLTGDAEHVIGLFTFATRLTAPGQSISFPMDSPPLIDRARGTVEMWVGLGDVRTARGDRYLLDTTESTEGGLRLSCIITSGTAQIRVLFAGAETLSWTPSAPELRFVHIAVAWDASGDTLGEDAAGNSIRAALYYQGSRVDSSTAELPPGQFDGRLYVGSSNNPSAGGQAHLPIDNLKAYSTVKTSFIGRENENDSGPVDMVIELDDGDPPRQLQASATPAGGRALEQDPPPLPLGIFKYALQSQGSIDITRATTVRSFIYGYVHADESLLPTTGPAVPIYGGTASSGSIVHTPLPDLAAYRAVADHVIEGDFTFEANNTYTGVYYITGDATIEGNVTIDGTVIAEGAITGNRGLDKTSYLRIQPDRAGYPAMIGMSAPGGNLASIDFRQSQYLIINGLIYGGEGVDFSLIKWCRFRGSIVCSGPGDTLEFVKPIHTSITYSLPTTPPYFN